MAALAGAASQVAAPQATRLGFAQRTKVHITWRGTTLRLEARERRLELQRRLKGWLPWFFRAALKCGVV